MRFALASAALAVSTVAASADIRVSFIESAPKDRFVIENAGGCEAAAMTVTLDLSTSAGRLIFDTTGAGAGVDVFQPFETAAGGELIESATAVVDGDDRITLELRPLAPRARVAFTIDVDDRLEASDLGQIRVSGSEISGATASATSGATSASGAFSEDAKASLKLNDCLS